MQKKTDKKERVFTVELKSRGNLKNLTLTTGCSDAAVLEGSLGEFVEASFTEGVILTVVGTYGVLRVDLKEDEIKKAPQKYQPKKTGENNAD